MQPPVLLDAQRRRLEELEAQTDRFQREVPQSGTAPAGSDLLVTGVPEPHEWALIGLSAAILAVMAWRRRRLTGQQPTGPAVG